MDKYIFLTDNQIYADLIPIAILVSDGNIPEFCADKFYFTLCSKSLTGKLHVALKKSGCKFSVDAWKKFTKGVDYFQNNPSELADAVNSVINACEDGEPLRYKCIKSSSSHGSKDDLTQYYESLGYIVSDNSLYMNDKDGYPVQLTNFIPIPTFRIYRKDGEHSDEISFCFKALRFTGDELPEVEVKATEFESLSWVTPNWAAKACVFSGRFTKDKATDAFKRIASQYLIDKTIYTHTGWTRRSNKYIFLHGGGAIGESNITIKLDDKLSSYILPSESSTTDVLRKAVKHSLDFINVASHEITYPMLALVYLSPLNEFFRIAKIEPSFIMTLLGATGTKKSTLTALALSHFGDFAAKDLPGSFRSTHNSLERQGFALKDVLAAIDDYHPTTQASHSVSMNRAMQEMTRSYGDRSGRGRMNPDGTLKKTFTPRGNVIISAEDKPDIGESGLARHYILTIEAGSVNISKLSEMQDKSELLPIAMRGYIEWIIPQCEELPAILHDLFIKYRDEIRQNQQQHGRLAEATAWLKIGIEMFSRFVMSLGGSDDKHSNRMNEFKIAVTTAHNNQIIRMKNEKPVELFLAALIDMLGSGKCYVVEVGKQKEYDKYGNLINENPKGDMVGYFDNEYHYFYIETIYNLVYSAFKCRNQIFPIGKDMLLKHLEDAGMINIGNSSRTKVKSINGKKIRLLWIKNEFLTIGVNDIPLDDPENHLFWKAK